MLERRPRVRLRDVRRLTLVVGSLAAGMLPAGLAAQGATEATGTWRARWAASVRTERDGSITVRREADATLVLEVAGDSLVGRWTFELPGPGRSSWHVHGQARGGRLRLVGTEAETERPPPPGAGAVVRQEWTGTLRNDRIEGEHWMILRLPDGSERRSGPRPWSAVRREGAVRPEGGVARTP